MPSNPSLYHTVIEEENRSENGYGVSMYAYIGLPSVLVSETRVRSVEEAVIAKYQKGLHHTIVIVVKRKKSLHDIARSRV